MKRVRMIDADELIEHVYRERLDSRELIAQMVENAPTIEPERENGYRDGYKRGKQSGYKKGMAMRSRITVDVIKDFHDYQVGWLTSHHDITLSPEEENLILNFLHDTADCYVLEVGALK